MYRLEPKRHTEVDLLDQTNILPLIRKNFARRTGLDGMLSKMIEKKGVWSYHNGEVRYHQTDGIAFQPGALYVCGIDNKLLKWKYFDTVTI